MDISSDTLYTLLSPAAAYTPFSRLSKEHLQKSLSWKDSAINPKNLPDSIGVTETIASWHIDGIDVDGRKFFVVPNFMRGRLPLRVDLHLPPHEAISPALREIFCLSNLMIHGSGKKPIMSLEISKFLLRALDHWHQRVPDFETQYMNLPFGSRIMIDHIAPTPGEMKIYLVPIYDVEQQFHSLKKLQEMWDLPTESWPPAINLNEIQLEKQPHEAISLVKIPSRHEPDQLFVFKSLCRDVNYLYHELKVLLKMEPHRNIIQRPFYIVTKKCKFGGKIGVCGFILKFYPGGTLRDALGVSNPFQDQITLRDRFRWAKDVCSALLHVQNSFLGYYPDLKPDNLIMSRDDKSGLVNVSLIDFEQRGGWFSWSPPEVYYLEYLEALASSKEISPIIRNQYSSLLRGVFPLWKPANRAIRYKDEPNSSFQGYSLAWGQLTRSERESAHVFMLGKILWCIFESAASINCHMGVDFLREELNENQQLFPKFRQSPESIRSLIKACTIGAPEWSGHYRCISRQGDRIMATSSGEGTSTLCPSSPDMQLAWIQAWWKREIQQAEAFFARRALLLVGKTGEHLHHDACETMNASLRRPKLDSVLAQLQDIETSMCFIDSPEHVYIPQGPKQ